MKTYKTFGIAAAVWAAVVCVATQSGRAEPVGDIWSIRRASGGDHGTEELSMANNPLTAGQKVKFKLRLLNRDPVANAQAQGSMASATTWDNRWYFKYVGPGSTNEAAAAASMNPPQIGVWLSGHAECRWAEIESLAPVRYTNEMAEVVNYDFTDLICSYTAQPGDFGLLTLAAGSESSPVEASPNTASSYCLKNSAYWGIYDKLTTTNACWFWLNTSANEGAISGYVTFPSDDKDPRFKADLDLSQAGIYIKTIDFDDYKFNDDGIWRRIAANGTSSYINEGKVKRAPALAIPGSVAEGNTVTLYAWMEDETVAYMKDGTQIGGTGPRVVPIQIAPSDGETKEIPGGIFALEDATNKTTRIFLCATPTNIFRSGVLITNFVTQTIKVGPPEPPSIVLLAQGESEYTATAGSPVEIVPISVTLEGVGDSGYGSPLEVTVAAEMIGSALDSQDYIGLSVTSPTADPGTNRVTVTIPSGYNSALVYAYIKRAKKDETTASDKGIEIKAIVDTAAETFFSGGIISAILHIKPSAPIITSPAEGASYQHVPGGSDYPFRIAVDDAPGEMTSGSKYTVYWSKNGSWSDKETFTNLTLTAGVLSIKVKYMTGGTFDSQFYVANQDADSNAEPGDDFTSVARTIRVQVDAPRVITLSADRASQVYAEGDSATITLKLSEQFSTDETGYLFLVPQNKASSNLVECAQFKTGAQIKNGDTAPLNPITLKFLDNSAEALSFTAVLRSKADINEGDAIGGFTSRILSLSVTNKYPVLNGEIKMGTRALPENSDTMEESVALGVPKTFSVTSVDDVPIDLTNENFVTQWSFENGVSNVYLYGKASTNKCTYVFESQGRKKVSVRFIDKDILKDNLNDLESAFTGAKKYEFWVNVLDEPTISVLPVNGSSYLLESDAGSNNARFKVLLNVPASQKITVALTVTNADNSVGGLLPKLNTYYLDFRANQVSNEFTIVELDGTAKSESIGFLFSAAVTNETAVPDSGGKNWSNYYTVEPYTLFVRNEAPVIGGDPPSNIQTNEASLNVPITINWTAKDVLPDMTNGLTATWVVPGEGTFVVPITNTSDRLYRGTFTFTFTKQTPEYREVVLTLTDKDKGTEEYFDTRRYMFHVAAQKVLNVLPLNAPDAKGQTVLSQKYVRMKSKDGLGAGRAWADGALSIITGFLQTWNYSAGDTVAWVYAYGYRAGEADNGNLQPITGVVSGTKLGINAQGNSADAAPWYTWTSDKDSFFYCWLSASSEDGESSTDGSHLSAPAPVVGTNSLAVSGRQRVSINVEAKDEEHPSYDPVLVEAVFAKEFLVKDNMGDINADGIPDIYAVDTGWQGGLLFEAAGGTLEDGGDLVDLRNWNGDTVSTQIGQTTSGETGDFLPSATSSGNGSLIPNVQSSWALYGRPFTAYLELRGFGEGLNYRRDRSGTQGLNSSGEWIGERDFTEVESNAWSTVYGEDAEWTPENRTDPTVDDTDGDGLPDGYEYYFWYHAYVGDPESGERLTGERFSLEALAVGTPIESDEIARLFNPNVASGTPINERDSDGDGLTDLEEFALGTNPLHWDTDGDHISDYWEVLRGLNPLVAEPTNANNPDGDFMAKAEIGKGYTLISFANAEGKTMMYALSNAARLIDATTGAINEAATNNATGIPVFRYGDETGPLVPTSRGVWMKGDEIASVAGTSYTTTYYEYTCTEKPTEPKEIDWTGLDDIANVTIQEDQTLIVIHDQVMAEFGFDPRTAWYKNSDDRVNARWNKAEGAAVNTVPYTSFDEYMLLKYRYMTALQEGVSDDRPGFVKSNPKDSSDKTFNLDRDVKALADKKDTLGNIFVCGTTNPNIPFSKTYTEESATEYADENHGADTDEDGVPDGWALYVGYNPNLGTKNNDAAHQFDGTEMGLAAQFAGTDTCSAYPEVETIYANLPASTTGWINKFWPTNPWNGDTDGDYIRDDVEGGRWTGYYRYNQTGGFSYSFTFVYDETDGAKPAVSATAKCVRGGGMNPCSVDTDGDRLPDTWEMCYAGLLFTPVGQPSTDHNSGVTGGLGSSNLLLIRRGDNLKSGASAAGYYIAGGMDATDPNDAFGTASDRRTGTSRDFDFDHDGLQNFQEYLVQTLRHLRYDDAMTPLMGRWMPDGTPATEKFLGFLPMNVMDGETFRARATEAGFVGFSAGDYFRTLGYFARPVRDWDPVSVSSLTKMVSPYDGETGGYRVMLPPSIVSGNTTLRAFGYASTDPRCWDSDGDNMDDFYELFHGLNPLLGSVKDPMDGKVIEGDLICVAYGRNPLNIAYWNNAWMGWPGPFGIPDWLSGDVPFTFFDAMKYPWMMGTPEADADGDGIRNSEEALVVNMTSPQPTHTDPTPLWMTDSTALNKASYVSQYYLKDPDQGPGASTDFDLYWWNDLGGTTQTKDGATVDFLFAFEENEGYDTDHDWISDSEEQKLTSTPMSDAQKFTDPDRRQAIWFPGENSAAISRTSNFHRLNYQSYDTFRQFTVEAWIKPEVLDREQVIIERTSVYGASTLSNNLAQVRANFRIGITADGYLYGSFDTNDAVPSGTEGSTATVLGGKATTSWTHVAFSFDGTNLRLYMNGRLMKTEQTHLIPANGLVSFVEDAVPNMGNFPVLGYGYTSVPCAVVLGARAQTKQAFEISEDTAWTDFGDFYAGYLDEVRVWDGARTEADIVADKDKRYSFADVSAQRDEVYEAWVDGATRNDNDGKDMLPVELVMHYNFQTLPGAVNAADVAWEPSGFTKNVFNNDKIEGWNVPGDIYCGWWYGAKDVRSTVYRNWRLVPWIQNTVGHLPPLDGSTVDSEYWSKWYGGFTAANEVGVDNIVFPNTANPYPYTVFQTERYYHQEGLARRDALALLPPDVVSQYRFDLRTAVVGTSDLVPLGGTFAKRCEEMWDGHGAADAWQMTKRDTNANGIPDWWEKVAKERYGAADGFGWDSIVTYDGREMTAREAYQRDIQKGMLPDGVEPSPDSPFVDRAFGVDGLPTWWRNFTGVHGSATDDDDNDGLSNFVEYQISEVATNVFWRPNPVNAYTYAAAENQLVPDYFLRAELSALGITSYLGFLATDHDFMENEWEDEFDPKYSSRAIYDAWKDADDDGWSNFAEARAGSNPSRQNDVGVDGYQIAGHPVPDIALALNNADGSVFTPGQIVRVQAYSDGKLESIPSALWTVSVGERQERFLGVNSGRKMKFVLGPGAIKQGTVNLEFKSPVWYQHKTIYKNGIVIQTSGTYSTMSAWQGGAHDIPFADDPTKGGLYWGGGVSETIGTVDYVTGEVEFDFALCNGGTGGPVSDDSTTAEGGDVTRIVVTHDFPSDKAWFRIAWTGVMAAGNSRQTLHLSAPEEATPGVSDGLVREGKNTFVAFIDEDNNGAYTAGEPYGVVADVDVGWFGTSCAIELSRVAPQLTRAELPGAGETRMRVVRALLNGEVSAEEALIERTVDVATHPYITEADLLANGDLDLDWGTLANAWLGAGNANIAGLTNATYSVLTGEGTATMTNVAGEVIGFRGTAFDVRFEAGAQQTLAVPVEPMGGAVYAASPTFRWTHANSISKSYPAFRLRVWGADGETLVYDSGARQAPTRDSNGVYEWTAPIYTGMVTPQGVVFEAGKAYRWTVSMLDAKFTEPNGAETKGDFTLACTGDIRDDYGYGSIDVAVKYFGALAEKLPTDATLFTNLVRVQAFESPDFTGTPVGEAFVTNVADIASISNLTVNATIVGLKPGTYYVRAFVDTDADCAWSRWESWGYANYVGTDNLRVYTPRAVTVAKGAAVPNATVYVEDADTNNNGEPDAWEWDEKGTLGASAIGISAGGAFELPEDGGALLDSPLELDGLDLTLKPAPIDPVTLKLTIESLTGDQSALPTLADTNGVALACETNEAGVVIAHLEDVTDSALRVRLLGMDGTASSAYLVTATATNALDRYRPGEFRLTVTNIAPVITYTGAVTNDCQTNAVPVKMSASNVIEIPVTLDDVAADKAAGLHVYWMGDGLVSLDDYGTVGAAVLTPNGETTVTNGVTLVTNKVEATFSFMFSGGTSGTRVVTLVAEDKDGGVSTREFWYEVFAPQDDSDGDGLSNESEWLAEAIGYLPDGSYTNVCSDGVTPDYWRTVTVDGKRRYLGELFADHDHMDDDWEDAYDIFFVNSAIWDAAADPDGDGWSNWSEASALTDPSLEARLSLVSAEAEEDRRLPEYPVPTVRMKVSYNGVSDAFNGKIVVKAWHGSALSGKPDASWTVDGPDSSSASCSRFIGVNPNRVVRFNLGPGMIAEQHCAITFFDPHCYHVLPDDIEYYSIDTSHWHGCTDLTWHDDPTVQPKGPSSAAFGFGYVDYRTGDVEIDFTKFQNRDFRIAISPDETAHLDLSRSFVRVDWVSRVVTKGNTKEFHLSLPDEDSSTLGYLREGKTTFVAFADANGNGVCDAGEPYGFVRDVDVGWDEVPEIPILLTDDDAGMRFAVDGAGIQRVRVVRTAINGVESRTRTVWSRKVDLGARNWFAEADFVGAGAFDFDWNYLCEDAAKLGIAPDNIKSATYAVLLSDSSSIVGSFTRTFDSVRVKPSIVSPSDSAVSHVYTVRPEFVWTGADDMSAFQLQIARDAEFTDIVWDSGTNFLSVSGNRAWKAPIYVGEQLADNTSYFWRVAEMNARYQSPEGYWSDPAEFRTQVSSRGVDLTGGTPLYTGYSGLELDVRYYGPSTESVANVIVGVYENADFTGYPAARLRLAGDGTVEALTNNPSAGSFEMFNKDNNGVVSFAGLAPGSYYAMAFIDLNTNGVRDAYEPWGYVKDEMGTGNRHHPGTLLVQSEVIALPNAVILMEDTDVNGNDMPDCLEGLEIFMGRTSGTGSGGTSGDVGPDSSLDSDGDGLPNGQEDELGTESASWDTDGDGMPDGWEAIFAGTDPLTDDGYDAADRDVMAYVVTNLTMVTVWDGVNEISATNRYVVMDHLVPQRGDDASALANLRSVYDYGGKSGLGQAATAAGFVYAVETNVEVVLVHAQVYEFFGFDPTTANPAAVKGGGIEVLNGVNSIEVTVSDSQYGVNTKPFTALDKYLVCRYLEKVYGLANEVDMNTNGTWAAYTLAPGDADNDVDGVPDGWELYMMFGTDGATATLDDAAISPFSYDDARAVAPGPNSDLTVLEEFGGGTAVTDPWSSDTDGDGISDRLEHQYGLVGDAGVDDADNDGLSNYIEYLISQILEGKGYDALDSFNAYSWDQAVPDYFLPAPDADGQYLGFVYGDHDFMDDWWEDLFDPDYVSRFAFDPWADPDDDGWSNWAEARAGTDPTQQNVAGVDGYTEVEHPVPNVTVTLVQEDGTSDAPIYVTAYPDGKVDEMPDAKWTIGGDAASERYLGANPKVGQTVTLGPCEPGSVHISMKTPVYFNHTEVLKNKELQRHDVSYSLMSEWIGMISDKPRAGDQEVGDMIWAGMLNHPVGWINYRTGELYIDFSLAPTAELVKESTETETVPKTNAEGGDAGADVITTSKYKEYPTDGAWFLAKWQSVLPSGTWRHTVYLGTPEPAALNVSRGALREGKTTFVAFLDEDGDGAWTPGEPYGVTTGVDVGWFGTSCEIELSRTASQVTRMNVPAVAGSSDFNAANDLTDRRVVGAWTAANIESGLTSEADLSTRVVRMRILRTLVNGERFRSEAISADGAAITYDEVVYDRKIDFATHPLLTEETVLTAGMFDLDWGTLTDAWLASGKGSIGGLTNVAYRIVLGEGSDVLEDGNGLPLMFVNAFENGLEQTAAIPVEPNGGKVHSARPTFRWRHPNPIGKSYPAFRLRVWSPDDDANPVYDSGVQPAPARTDDDVYEWKAPLCAGMVTPNGWVFGATNQYIWTVSMLDAKYIEPNASEARCRFQMDVDGQVAGGDSDYGALDVCVRYYGPTEAKAVTTSPTLGGKTETVTNIIRVQAFTAPDFAGDPAGEAYVTNVTDLASLTDVTTANARIRGLKPGAYYVRTFIDSDADGVWSRWETWGYANYVGDANAEYLYMPRAASVTAGAPAKTVTVYMEDMDTNLDRMPDADEFSRWGAIGTSAITVISADGSQFVPEVCVLEDGSLTDSWLDVTLHPAPADIGKSVTLTLAVTRPLGEETVWPTLCMDGTALAWEEAEVTNAAGVATARVYTLSGVTDAVTRIYLDRNSLDGAERSVYTVKVSSDAADQYDRSEFRFSVTNVAPVIGPTEYGNDSLTNAVAVHLGDAFTIPVTIDDVPADVAAGLIVVWRGDGLFSVDGAAAVVTGNGFLSETNGMPVVTERVAGNYAFTFAGGSSGLRAVTLQVTDKDGGVAERTYWYNVIAPEDDFDNDGLDNWIEESLIPEAGFDPTSFTEPWSFDGQQVPDYFLAAGSSYLGFMFTDHDFMDDWWEDLFDPDYVSRYPFDAWDDPDQDGWSNWAEARAGTDPTQTMSMVLDGDSIFEVPTPTIRLRVVYPNVKTAISASNLVVQAYGDRESFENGAPNAVWSVPIVEAQPFTRNLGVNPGGTVRLNLGPGSVVPGSVSVAFRDPNTVLHAADGTYAMLDAASAPWVPGLNEYFVPGETPLLVRVTPDQPVGTIDYETGDVVMDLARMQDYLYSVDGDKSYQFFEPGASNEWKRLDLSKSYMQIRWNGKVLSDGRKWETSLSEPNVLGHLREGKTMFVVFADGDGNGLWTPGEPYGVVTDIDVGWAGTSVEVELTDISSRILRMDLEPLVNAKDLVAANEATDRGVLSDYAYYPNEAAKYYGTNDIGKVLVRVRVVRSWFNGEKTNATAVAAASGNVFEGMFDLRGHPCLTEADLLARGELDLDWGDSLVSAWVNFMKPRTVDKTALTNVAYRIVLGNGTESGTSGDLNNLVPLVFYNAFEYGLRQTLAKPVSPAGAVCSAQPTFTWTHEAKDATGRTIKDYPAFQLRVWKQDGTTLVYDSGIRPAPARNVVDGSYSWTAPIYPDMVTPQGHIFSTTNNYKWSVSMLDAKFTTPNGNETKMEFRLETSGALGTISDYGAAKACVRYYGPAKLSANAAALTNIIRVQAFTSPDFTGTPAGEAYVTTTNSINSATDVTTANALILGLKPGMYYLRAFVDSDGDCDWSRWETWGYANYVSDTNAVYRYTPRAVAVEKGAPVPMAVIFMEDMDTDRDYLPDAMEWNLYTSLAKRSAPTGNTFFTRINPTFATSVQGFARNSAIQTANAPLRLMSAGPQAENLAFLALPAAVAAELTAPDAVQVRISSFSLAGGVSLTVSSSLTPGDYGALTVTENDDVNVYLVAAKTPDFADAKETLVKTGITIKANDETKEVVSAAELKAAIEAADLSDAAFFKVRIEK